MASFRSNEDFFQAVADFIAKLEIEGHRQAADQLREGFRCLNGLTDGWALFLESIEKVQAIHSKGFGRGERQTLETIRKAVDAAVYRR
jgi:hypothetical protein